MKTVRTARFEVKGVDGDWADTNKRWFVHTEECRHVTNFIYQTWLVWHVQNGSADKLRAWLNERQENGIKAAGKCPVQSVPSELGKKIYHGITEHFPEIHIRTVALLQKVILQSLNGKSQTSKLPKHSAILLWHESLPTARRKVPLRFDKQNATIEPPKDPGDNWRIHLKVTRIPREGNRAVSVIDNIEMHTNGRSMRSQVEILKRIGTGEYEAKGSQLYWDDSNRKWFVCISYQMPIPERPPLDDSKSAALVPAFNHPFTMFFPDGKTWNVGHRGRDIRRQRERIFLQRRSRSEYHKHASTSRKGHGRGRSQNWRWKLQRAWLNIVKKINHDVSTRVVRECVCKGIGNLVYFQPSGKFAESRFVATAGKDNLNDATTWEFFQLGTMLAYKCEEAGINFKVWKEEKSKKKNAA